MNTNRIMLTLAVACAVAGYWLQNSKTKETHTDNIRLSNIIALMDTENTGSESDDEKSGGILDWWKRKDWICVNVTCTTILGKYKSTVAQKVADGTGTEAHSWSCPGCGDNGYIVDTEKE